MKSVAQSVALLWRPARYAVAWAHIPDEVPNFDPSSGGDPFALVFDAGYFKVVNAALGGGQDPPGPTWRSDDLVDESGELTHIEGPNYPRLVRTTMADVGEKKGPDDPVERLAELATFKDESDFMAAACTFAGEYGPLSYAEMDFSLEVWKHTAEEMHAHLSILRELTLMREVSKDSKDAQILIKGADRQVLHESLGGLSPYLASPPVEAVSKAIDSSHNLAELRDRLANLYWEAFGHHLRPYRHPGAYFVTTRTAPTARKLLVDVGDVPGQLVVRCGSLGWSLYQLWAMASKALDIRQCEGCGRLFQATRPNKRHCEAGCRPKSFRKRQRAAT